MMKTEDCRGVGRPATPKRLASKRLVISGRSSMAPQPVPKPSTHKEFARAQLRNFSKTPRKGFSTFGRASQKSCGSLASAAPGYSPIASTTWRIDSCWPPDGRPAWVCVSSLFISVLMFVLLSLLPECDCQAYQADQSGNDQEKPNRLLNSKTGEGDSDNHGDHINEKGFDYHHEEISCPSEKQVHKQNKFCSGKD